MKHLFLHRAISALLCLALALSLTACGGGIEPPETEGGSGMTGALSGGKGNVSEPKDDPDDPEKAEAGLVLLRACMAEDDQLAGAVAYLGQREPNDRSSMTEWLLENSGDLVSELPFLLEIPAERVLGGESGKLYCIVPRDESTSLAVNHVTWESQGNGVWPVADEVLYREEYAQPVLVFVNYEEWPDEPDTEVNLVTNDGVAAIWYPQEDGYGNLFLPTDEAGAPMLYDFAIYGYTTGLDYPEGWEPSGDDWWWPPTELGLADTSWLCDSWVLELRGGDASPEYAGTADLYYAPAGYIKQDYLGVWRMEDDCLYLKLSADSGDEIDASFPILISPSGEDLYFQRSRTGAGIPFLPDGTDSIGLLLYTG